MMTSLLCLLGGGLCALLGTPRPSRRLPREAPRALPLRRPPFILGAAAAAVLGVGVVLTGQLSTALSISLLSATLVSLWRRRRRQARTQRVHELSAQLVGHILADLRAGHSMPQALAAAAESDVLGSSEPARGMRTLIGVAATRAHHGGRGGAVLTEAQNTYPDLAECGRLWDNADRHGIPMVPLLEHVQRRIDAHLRHHRATAASLQGAQATALILSALPLVGIALGSSMGAHPLRLLLGGGLGGILLLSGVALCCAGLWWCHLIISTAGGTP